MKESLLIIEELKNNTQLLIKKFNSVKSSNTELSNELLSVKQILKDKDNVIIKLKEKYNALEMENLFYVVMIRTKQKEKLKK